MGVGARREVVVVFAVFAVAVAMGAEDEEEDDEEEDDDEEDDDEEDDEDEEDDDDDEDETARRRLVGRGTLAVVPTSASLFFSATSPLPGRGRKFDLINVPSSYKNNRTPSCKGCSGKADDDDDDEEEGGFLKTMRSPAKQLGLFHRTVTIVCPLTIFLN